MLTYAEIVVLLNCRLRGGERAASDYFGDMRRLMHALGDPQDRVCAVHIAGTNGKGSTAAFVSAVAQCGGKKTGLFTSPHIERYNERIRVDGQAIADGEFVRLYTQVVAAAEQLALVLPGFSMLTAMAFCYFAEQRCALMVIETGLGGRYDATNIVKRPLCCALTAIDYDHTALLGTDIASITAEKCGIIKAGVPVVALEQRDEVNEIVADMARHVSAPLTVARARSITVRSGGLDGQRFSYGHWADIAIRLNGRYQLDNAAVALSICDVLLQSQLLSSRASVIAGMSAARWPGRLEIARRGNKIIVVDGAHNPQGARMLAQFIHEQHLDDAALVFAGLRGKDTHQVVRELGRVMTQAYITTVDNPLALGCDELAEIFGEAHIPAMCCDNVRAAIHAALAASDTVVVCGTLYLLAEARAFTNFEF